MEVELIVLIIAAAIFVILLVMYFVVSLRQENAKRRLEKELHEAYSDENITKMDYDIATYYNDSPEKSKTDDGADGKVNDAEQTENIENKPTAASTEAIFTHVGDDSMEEIRGNYNSDNSH